MPDMLGSLGDFFGGSSGKGLLDVLGLGTAGAGLIGNIATERARSNQLNQVTQAEKTLANPQQLAKEVASATQPLNEGLVQSVGNTVSGSLAEQGLSQAPGIQGTVLAQALAPFEQQNQNTALQLVLEHLGLPLQYIQTYLAGLPKSTNVSPILAMLMRSGGPLGGNPSQTAQNNPYGFDLTNSSPGYNAGPPPAQTAGAGTITDTPIDLSGFFDSAVAA